jgi:hypothetical protein
MPNSVVDRIDGSAPPSSSAASVALPNVAPMLVRAISAELTLRDDSSSTL